MLKVTPTPRAGNQHEGPQLFGTIDRRTLQPLDRLTVHHFWVGVKLHLSRDGLCEWFRQPNTDEAVPITMVGMLYVSWRFAKKAEVKDQALKEEFGKE